VDTGRRRRFRFSLISGAFHQMRGRDHTPRTIREALDVPAAGYAEA